MRLARVLKHVILTGWNLAISDVVCLDWVSVCICDSVHFQVGHSWQYGVNLSVIVNLQPLRKTLDTYATCVGTGNVYNL